MAIDNELDPQFILTLAQRLNKCCYLPVLAGKQLKFRQFSATTPLHANRYGILEPMVQPSLALAAGQCDVILVPLVQVDGLGHRLGMGKGFYDRTFSRQRILQRPWLIGLAYECQKLAYVPHTARDICLDALVTEKKFYAFSSH
jgi:5-formyltetrahydrofolate cyclo-ligase